MDTAEVIETTQQIPTALETRQTGRGISRVACEKCRQRKIKCEGSRPRCARCFKNDLDCVYIGANPSWRLVAELEHRIRELEKEDRASRADPPTTITGHISPTPHPLSSSENVTVPAQPSPSILESSFLGQQSWHEDNGHVRPARDISPERLPQLPTNSQLLDQLPPTVGIPSPLVERETLPHRGAKLDPSLFPLPRHAEELKRHFLACTNIPFPIFHMPSLDRMLDSALDHGARQPMEDSVVILFMFALAAVSLPKTSPLKTWHRRHPGEGPSNQNTTMPVSHKELYEAACVYHDGLDRLSGTRSLQILIMRTQYVLYEPSAGNVWDLSGAAVRKAVDLGYHLETGPRHLSQDALHVDMRRRLFWSAYAMDRVLCFGLGRPPAVEDSWITCLLPSPLPDASINTSGCRDDVSDPDPRKLAALFHFKVRRLQSEIYGVLYNPNSAVRRLSPDPDWYDSVQNRLEGLTGWAPAVGFFVTKSWINLNYKHAMVLLHRPSPVNPNPPRQSLEKALRGAAGMMVAYKEMYRSGRINYNWVSMYHLFTAGVTYLITLWQAHANGWKLVQDLGSAMFTMQSCMSTMEALAALTPGTMAILNAFENVSHRIIRHLTSSSGAFSVPGSPTLARSTDVQHAGYAGHAAGYIPEAAGSSETDAGGNSGEGAPPLSHANLLDMFGMPDLDLPPFASDPHHPDAADNIPDPGSIFDDVWQQMLNPDFQWHRMG